MSTQRRIVLTMLAAASALLSTGCPPGERNHQWLLDGEKAYDERNYATAIDRLTQFINEQPNSPAAARAYYVRGMSLAYAKQRHRAYGDLRQAVQLSADSAVRTRAAIALGTLYFEDEQWEAAAKAYDVAAENLDAAAAGDAVLWRLALCHERSGRWSLERDPLTRLVSAYPKSVYADDAQRRLDLRPDHFAIQCGVFSTQESAERLVRELSRHQLASHRRIEPRNNRQMHIVLVGRYTTYATAQRELANVKAYVPDAVIWP